MLLSGSALPTPLNLFGADVWVDPSAQPFVEISVVADNRGVGELRLPIPPGSSLQGQALFTQFVWHDACALGGLSASWPLQITAQ